MILRVATFNIRTGRAYDGANSWPCRRRTAAAVIAALDADVFGLQEVYEFQRRYLNRRLGGLRWFGLGRFGGRAGEQCPIAVTNAELRVVTHQTRWYGPQPASPGTRLPGASFPRIATLVRCRDESSGAVFDVVNTHLDEHLPGNRATSTGQLAGWLDPGVPTVVLGDFNARPDADAVLRPMVDAGLERVSITGGTAHNFTGRADGVQIDHVFVSKHWTVDDAAVVREFPGRRLPSDHWPVVVTARLTDR